MIDIQLLGSLLIIGILVYSAMVHGIVYYRIRDHRLHGAFAILCLLFSAYTATNIIALFFVTDIATYVLISKLSSVFVILAILGMSWFASEFLLDERNIPLKPIAIALAPFFVLNLFMENGILWSSIEGIESSVRPWGSNVMMPVNAVVSWPMYGLWIVIAGVYILLVRAAYLSMKQHHRKRGTLLLSTLIVLTLGFAFDMSIDLGINKSFFYVSEYLTLGIVLLMSLHLTDELRQYAVNLETLVSKRTQALQDANDELESFSYSASHDLRAPLRTINGFLTILKQDYTQQLGSEANSLMSKVFQGVKRMEEIIDGMLHLSQVSREQIQRQQVNISRLAAEIAEELRDKYPDRIATVNIDENLYRNCDPALIRIMLENLFDNAWKYTSGTDAAEMSLKKYLNEANKTGFVISDNGAGFNEKYADKLFLPFKRLHSNEEFPGTGIGLATVARIVKKHGGEIWAESKKNTGTKVYFFLD